MSTAQSASQKPEKSKARVFVLILVLFLIIIVLAIFYLKRTQPAAEVLTPNAESDIVYIEDDSLWNPDAVIEDENHILEMKFGS